MSTIVSRRRRRRGVVMNSEFIRGYRRRLGLTQERLADLSGLTLRTVATAEGGHSVSFHSAEAISRALGVAFAAVLRPSPDDVRSRLTSAGYAPGPQPRPWAGRRAETTRIIETLRGKALPAVVVVAGPSGIGKTALGQHAASELAAAFPNGIVWVSATAIESADRVTRVQLDIADALGFRSLLAAPERVPQMGFDRSFQQQLWADQRLLVIDDVSDPALIGRLAGDQAGVRLLVTTTHRAVAARIRGVAIELGPLSMREALDLMRAHVGEERVAADPTAAEQLVKVLHGVPRSLQIAGRTLAREHLTRIADYLVRLSEGDGSAPWSQAGDPDASFATADRQLRKRLSETTWQTFGALSVFGPHAFTASWAAAVAGLTESEARRHLSALADLYLLRSASGDPLASSEWLQLDAQAQRVARWSAGERAHTYEERLVQHAAAEARRLGQSPRDVACVEVAGERSLWRLVLDYLTELAIGAQHAVQVPEDLPEPAGDERASLLPRVLLGLDAWLSASIPFEAARWLTAGLAVAGRTGDRKAQGVLALALGMWHVFAQGDFASARRWFDFATEALGDSHPTLAAQGRTLASGSTYALEGAEACLARMLQALEGVRRDDVPPTTRAIVTQIAGVVSIQCLDLPDRITRCRDLLEEARAIAAGAGPGAVPAIARTIIELDLALVRTALGEEVDRSRLDSDLAFVDGIVRQDHLVRTLLGWLAEVLGTTWRPEGLPTDPEEIFRGIPRELVPRRLIMLASIASSALRARGEWPMPGAPQGIAVLAPSPVGRIGHVDLLTGLPEAALLDGLVTLLLLPFDPLEGLFDPAGAREALAFITRSGPPGHPAAAMLERLAAIP